MKVLIDAIMPMGGRVGGVEQFVLGLVRGLGELADDPDEYIVLTEPGASEAFSGNLGANTHTSEISAPASERVKQLSGRLRPVIGTLRREARSRLSRSGSGHLDSSNGLYESHNPAVVHVTHHVMRTTAIPTVFSPHDLQHLHLPELFSRTDLLRRTRLLEQACNRATVIVTGSHWAGRDIMTQYGVAAHKVFVIPHAPAFIDVSDASPKDVLEKYNLSAGFAYYPAQTWAHKNHIRLLEALDQLRSRNVLVKVVCSGVQNEHFRHVRARMQELHLEDQVRFLGFVTETEKIHLYRSCSFVVFPSLFEGAGIPVLEAFAMGAPIACSNATSLPEMGGPAAHYFDPKSVDSIATSIEEMVKDSELRLNLARLGTERVKTFTWLNSARAYRAVYRSACEQSLSDEDASLLETLRTDPQPPPA